MSGQTSDEDSGSDVAVVEARSKLPKLQEPPKFAVILHNDDFTTMDFVVEVLRRFFQKTGDDAIQIMLRVHNEGKGTAGVYSFDIAETKVMQVHEYARSHGYPLRCSVEPAL